MSQQQEASSSSAISGTGSLHFDELALDVSGFGPVSASTPRGRALSRADLEEQVATRWRPRRDDSESELWEDYGVVEFLERGLAGLDESSEEERVEAMRETLAAETDILEAEGDLTDFLFHVARSRHGRVYVRVIRTLLLNRGIVLMGGRCSEGVGKGRKGGVWSWMQGFFFLIREVFAQRGGLHFL